MERTVNETNDLASLTTNVINVNIPGKIVSDPEPQELGRGHTFNRLGVQS
jgi:hypothetical protein